MSNATPVVLVHGGGFAASCWDLLLGHVDGAVLAVDLPGRRRHPAALDDVTIESAAASVVADIDEAGFDNLVLVGHSLAGCSMPATVGLLGDRVRHAVFVACTVPEDGTSCWDTLPGDIKALADGAQDDAGGSEAAELGVLAPDMARALFGNDLAEDQISWMLERMVPEAPRLTTDRVDLSPLRSSMPRTWVRTLHDVVVPADRQRRFVRNVSDVTAYDTIDLDAAHMCMISRPAALAKILNDIARGSEAVHSG
jgi:pimeloyl-ACP methyl ester carboxylesterase